MQGKVFTNVESPAAINELCVVADSADAGAPDSGLLLLAVEAERVGAYYIPALGPAPRWSAFLDSLTEELEEGVGRDGKPSASASSTAAASASVYEDYRFVSRDELAGLGLGHLVGTPLLRAYMHGYFMDAALHAKAVAHAAAEGAGAAAGAAERWRKARVRQSIEAAAGSRVEVADDDDAAAALPGVKVNRELARRLQADGVRRASEAAGGKAGRAAAAMAAAAASGGGKTKPAVAPVSSAAAGAGPASILTDDRFSRLFTDTDFAIDPDSVEYLRLHPGDMQRAGAGAGTATSTAGKRGRQQIDSDNDDDG